MTTINAWFSNYKKGAISDALYVAEAFLSSNNGKGLQAKKHFLI